MSPSGACILCGKSLMNRESISGTTLYKANCEICGPYICEELTDREILRLSNEAKAMMSAYTRELSEYNSPIPALQILDSENQIENIIKRYANKTIMEKFNNLLRYVGKKSDYFGKPLTINKEKDYPITYSRQASEFENIKEQALKIGFLEHPSTGGNVKLTLRGWERCQEIEAQAEKSKSCFIAMSCAAELRPIYENGIRPAVESSGYKPVFIEREEHNEKICDLILAEIRACKFVIADVTLQKQNVYYEAGFAQGLNKDVIWSCRADDISHAHFDTRQYNHIVWDSVEDINKKIFNRIKATIL